MITDENELAALLDSVGWSTVNKGGPDPLGPLRAKPSPPFWAPLVCC